jgi:membrane peptidoglycan carboxypeptidase
VNPELVPCDDTVAVGAQQASTSADTDVGDAEGGGAGGPADRRRRRKWKRRLSWASLVIGLLILGLAVTGLGYELALPSVSNAGARVAAIVREHHGELGRPPLPTRLAEAVVAVEDEHFYSNVFVNVFDGAARAGLASIGGSSDPGGSTIAQQLAKQLYPHGPGLGGTLEEIGLGVKLSLAYSKPEILDMYLNVIYYGNGYWGDVAAARGYFATSPDQLTWAEAAMLAGLPQAPSAYDPVRHFALAKQRQRHVLDRLVANHVLTAAQADAAYQAPLPLRRASR